MSFFRKKSNTTLNSDVLFNYLDDKKDDKN